MNVVGVRNLNYLFCGLNFLQKTNFDWFLLQGIKTRFTKKTKLPCHSNKGVSKKKRIVFQRKKPEQTCPWNIKEQIIASKFKLSSKYFKQ